jgi:hypothetical protein
MATGSGRHFGGCPRPEIALCGTSGERNSLRMWTICPNLFRPIEVSCFAVRPGSMAVAEMQTQ